MNGAGEQDLRIRKKINSLLVGQPSYLEGFINFMNDSLTRTKYNYLVIVLRFLNKVNKDIEQYTFDDFNNYMAYIKYKPNGEEYGKSYQIATYSALKKFCNYLYKSHRIKEDYMDDIHRPKFSESQETTAKREAGYLDEHEIKKMLKNSSKDTSRERKLDDRLKVRNAAIIYLFLGTGMRCSELTSIDCDDIDYKHQTVTVTTKGSKIKKYELSSDVCNYLELWMRRRKLDFGYVDDTNAFFITKNKKRMTANDVNYVVKSIAKYVTKKNISPHKLRASYGTELYNVTRDIYFVQDCMGHASPQTTELYIRGKKQNTKKASEIMGRLMKNT